MRERDTFGGNPIPHEDYHIILEDMINMSIRRAKRPYPMLRIQGEILTELISAEETASQYKELLTELESKKALAEDIAYVKAEWSKYRRLKYALRDIGDGIAWRLLGFDRFSLSQLASNSRKPSINKEGTVAELHELGDVINKNNRVAVLNDLTNFLKKGDITAELKDGSIELVEVKSSNVKNKRLTRQRNNLEQTISFLNEGEKARGEDLLQTTNLKISPQNYMRNIEIFLRRTKTEYTLVEKIGEHLIIHVTDFTSKGSDGKSKIVFKKLEIALNKWIEKGDDIWKMESGDRRGNVQNFAPFSIFPLPHEMRSKLMTGAMIISAYLNISAVLRYLSQRGWSILKTPKELSEEIGKSEDGEENEIVAVLKKGQLTVHLPAPIIGRLGHEFLSIKSLSDILDALFTMEPKSADALFLSLDGEASQWE